MKTIDNYISERLNPRHLGVKYNFSEPISLKGNLSWEFISPAAGKFSINCDHWWCGVIDYYSYSILPDHKALVFWSENSPWIFYLYGPEAENYWGAIEYDPLMKYKPKESIIAYLNKSFDEYCDVHLDLGELKRFKAPGQVKPICQNFEELCNR